MEVVGVLLKLQSEFEVANFKHRAIVNKNQIPKSLAQYLLFILLVNIYFVTLKLIYYEQATSNKQQATSNKLSIVFLLTLLVVSMSLLIHACTKDEEVFDSENNHTALQVRNESKTIFSPGDTIIETILGTKAPCNPYTVDIVTKAWNNLYPDRSVTTVPASHRYVKFKPNTQEEVYNLYKDSALVVWDHPLDYEIKQMGDYYNQPGKGENDLPDLYSVVDIDYNFEAGVAYEELEQLVKVPYNTILSAESFRLCNIKHIPVRPPGLPPAVNPPSVNPPNPDPPGDPTIDCQPDCPNYPCCFIEGLSCDEEMNSITLAKCGDIIPTCTPEDPNWPDCLDTPPNVPPGSPEYCICYEYESVDGDDEPTGFSFVVQLEEGQECGDLNYTDADSYYICESYTPPPPPPPPTNSCDCTRYLDTRKPAGCVNVQNPTNAGFTGVNNAKVIIRNTPCYDCADGDYIFFSFWTETTHTDENGCWKINKPCYGKIWVWVQFNNEDAFIRSPNFSASGSLTSGIEIDGNPLSFIMPVTDYVGGVSGPNFSNIQVNYSRWTTEGTQTQRYWCAAQTINAVADMHEMCNAEGINEPPHLDIYLGTGDGGADLMNHYGGASEIAAELGTLGDFLSAVLPDIYLGIDGFVDTYRRLNFHEMAHASHFTQVGAAWWNQNVNYQIGQIITNSDPYGDGTDPGAGFCAVSEGWAYHIGPLFDKASSSTMDEFTLRNGFIPRGIHWDLHDVGESSTTGIIDNVSGFTNEMIFDVLDANTTEISDLRTRLWNEHHNDYGVMATEPDYNILFNSYGY